MKRRQFIKTAVASGTVIGVGGVSLWLNDSSDKSRLTIDAVLAEIAILSKQSLATSGGWRLNQIVDHCAQSIEYSMIGFPKHKSAIFKNTLGRLAFSAFVTKGEMMHALDEPIPGAPLIGAQELTTQDSFSRLIISLAEFKEFSGDLAPHFAYGTLSKSDYEIAHALHFYNHLSEISQV